MNWEITEHFPNKPITNFFLSVICLLFGEFLGELQLEDYAHAVTWVFRNLAYLGASVSFFRFIKELATGAKPEEKK